MLSTYSSFFRRWAWLLALGVIAGVLVGYAFPTDQLINTTYRSSATVVVTALPPQAGGGMASEEALQERAAALVSQVNSLSVLEAVSADMPEERSLEPPELKEMITVSYVTNPATIRVLVSSNNPDEAQLVADRVSHHYFTHDIRIAVTGDDPDRVELVAEKVAQHFAEQTAEAETTRIQERTRQLLVCLQWVETELNKVAEERQNVMQQAPNGGAYLRADSKLSVCEQKYRDLYNEYISLNSVGDLTAEQLFSIPDLGSVEEVPGNRLRSLDRMVIGGVAGLLVAWLLAGGIDLVRRSRTSGKTDEGVATAGAGDEASDQGEM